MTWTQTEAVTGFASGTQSDSLSYTVAPAVATYNAIQDAQYTIIASGTQTIDLYSFTNALNKSTTATKALGFLIKGTGTNAKIKLEPGGTNPITWFWEGTTPGIELSTGSNGCALMLMDGTTHVVSATDRNLLVTNTGTGSLTLTVAIILGT